VRGYGWTPYFVEGSDPDSMHQAMAATVEHCVLEIRRISRKRAPSGVADAAALADDRAALAQGLGRPKKWTATSWKASGARTRFRCPTSRRTRSTAHSGNWMRSYQKPEELFDENGKLIPELKELAPTGSAA
jgi:xylulose-5-phosphate/fructose-6-phosphate phosphoketolase